MNPPIRLSEAQQRIIRHRHGHVQILACAGSGKTETVSRRIAELIAEGEAPGSIIAFTFTNAAADALKDRIHTRVKERLPDFELGRLSPMYVGTIHAFCLRFLQQHVPRYATFDLFESHQVVALLLREYQRIGLDALARELGVKNRTKVVQRFLESADVVDNEMMRDSQLPAGAFRDALRAYREALDGYHVLTHNQCIAQAVEALEDDELFRRSHAALRHLIVDEFQDINPAQAALIERLGRAPVCVCVVGDDDQAIYQWRGSDVAHFQHFEEKFKAHRESLDENRRSRKGIVTLAAAFADTIRPRMPKRITAVRPEGELDVHCFIAEDAEAEARLVADAIARAHERGTPYAAHAILLRSVATSSRPFADALDERRIPWRCAGTTGLFLQAEAKALAKAFFLLAGEKRWHDARTHADESVTLEDVARELASTFGAPELRIRDWLRRSRDAVPATQAVDFVGTLYSLFPVLGVERLDPSSPEDGARLATLARFSQLLADFESATRRLRRVDDEGRATGRGTQLRGASSDLSLALQRLARFIGFYAQTAYENGEDAPGLDVDAVTISTVHQAKGLEWPIVFVPCLSVRRFPSPRTGQPRDWLLPRESFNARRYEGTEEDERRLMYVAMTRAKDHLYLSTHERVSSQRVQPSPFFEELGGRGLQPSDRPLPIASTPIQVRGAQAETPTLSLSEVTAFLRCPMSYRLRLELGFQPRAAKELGYGKAVHHVLRRVAEYTRRTGAVPAAVDIDAIFDAEFFLPYADAPALHTMRRAAERLVERYVRQYQQDLLRTWSVERPFELKLSDANVTGRADVILDAGAGLTLVDYKTRISPDADEDFFTQLAVYAAAGRREGLDVRSAWLHDLSRDGQDARIAVPVDDAAQKRAVDRVQKAVEGIRRQQFEARPGALCAQCDVRAVCRACPQAAR